MKHEYRMFLASLLTAAFLNSAPAMAEYRINLTGNDLQALCNGTDPQTMRPLQTAIWRCIGYIEGIIDLWGKLRTFGAVKPEFYDRDFCLPRGVSSQVIIEIIQNHLIELRHSERSADSASSFVIPALVKAYPCRSG